MYPTLMLVILRESIWNAPDDPSHGLAASTVVFAGRQIISSEGNLNAEVEGNERVAYLNPSSEAPTRVGKESKRTCKA